MNTEPGMVSPANIATKNDELRKCLPNPLPFPHRAMMSSGVSNLPSVKLQALMLMVKNHSDFSEDPYGEHDFGSFDFEGQKIFWKFDYFDEDMEYFKEDGIRVLMIMFAHEY